MGINSTEVAYQFGQLGSAYISGNATDAITPPTDKVFVAITFLDNTVFEDAGGLVAEQQTYNHGSAVTVDRYIGTEQPANDLGTATVDEGTGGLIIGGTTEGDAVTFPKGVTIYGRWTSIQTYSGKCIAYIGE